MRSIRASDLFAGAAALAMLAATSRARAGDTAIAESLFQEAKKLMAKKNYTTACPKLAESQRLDPGGGTLLTLALCHEAEGKTASAWSEYTEAAAIAKRDSRTDRERIANKHAKGLEPKLVQLTIAVSAKVPGFELKRDGSVLGEAAWSTPNPIDPGEHEISASAPGKKPWSAKLTVRADEKQPSITVPALEDVPAPPPAAEAVATPATATESKQAGPLRKTDEGSQKTIGFVVLGVGVAAVGAGAFFGVRAASQSSDANDRCPQTECSDRSAVDLEKSAQTSALVSTIFLGAGAAAVIGGGVLVLTSPKAPRRESATIRPYATPTGAGVAGTF